MDRRNIYQETKMYTNKNWATMISYSLIVLLIGMILSNLMRIPNYLDTLIELIEQGVAGDTTNSVDAFEEMDSFRYILQFIVGSITSVLNAGLMFGVLQTYRDKTRLNIKVIFNQIGKKPFAIFLASLIISLINFILDFIPIIGSIISFIFVLASYFALLVLQENDEMEPIDALISSFKLTKGHKLNIFIIEIKYTAIVFLSVLGLLVLTLTGPFGLVLGIIVVVVVALRSIPNVVAAAVIYYNKLVHGDY